MRSFALASPASIGLPLVISLGVLSLVSPRALSQAVDGEDIPPAVEEYRERLSQLELAVDDLQYGGEPARQNAERAARRLENAADELSVRVDGERVRNQLRAPPSLDRLQGELRDQRELLEDSWSRPPRSPGHREVLDEAALQDASEIASGDDFPPRPPRPAASGSGGSGGNEDVTRSSRQAQRRIGPLESRERRERPTFDWELPQLPNWIGAGGAAWQVIVYVLAAVFLALALYWLVRMVMESRSRGRTGGGGEDGEGSEEALATDDVRTRAPEEFSASAARLAREGQHREAVRILYLELLARLYRAGRIQFDRTRTNWEYAAGLRSQAEIHASFQAFTDVFDHVWYGHRGCGAAEYEECRRHVLDIAEHLPMGA